eukprot:TRINITY_DN5778_c0_g1_i1.p1 TRINITY_DN5778_c0_g1~~TRINITY_DN5778_c0_g1_i1.p1  ORF type:complete len:225 (-),score=56.79 TRINITY_DN5778_c0_g1_i1:34-675(-)
MNGKDFPVGKFNHTLRMNLWKEHLGLLKPPKKSKRRSGSGNDNNGDGVDDDVDLDEFANLQDGDDDELEDEMRDDVNANQIDEQAEYDQILEKIRDPVIDEVYDGIWRATAQHNTEIYENVFPDIPRDSTKSLKLLTQGKRKGSSINGSSNGKDKDCLIHVDGQSEHPISCTKMLRRLKGNLTKFPMDFLSDESLKPSFKSPLVNAVDNAIFQ